MINIKSLSEIVDDVQDEDIICLYVEDSDLKIVGFARRHYDTYKKEENPEFNGITLYPTNYNGKHIGHLILSKKDGFFGQFQHRVNHCHDSTISGYRVVERAELENSPSI